MAEYDSPPIGESYIQHFPGNASCSGAPSVQSDNGPGEMVPCHSDTLVVGVTANGVTLPRHNSESNISEDSGAYDDSDIDSLDIKCKCPCGSRNFHHCVQPPPECLTLRSANSYPELNLKEGANRRQIKKAQLYIERSVLAEETRKLKEDKFVDFKMELHETLQVVPGVVSRLQILLNIESSDYDSLFKQATKDADFINYEPLEKIVKHCARGNGAAEKLLKDYQDAFHVFAQRRVFSFPEGSLETHTPIQVGKVILQLKIEEDFRRFLLDRIQQFKTFVKKILNLDDQAQLFVRRVREGCVELTFDMFEKDADKAFSNGLTLQQKREFAAHNISMLECNDKVHYCCCSLFDDQSSKDLVEALYKEATHAQYTNEMEDELEEEIREHGPDCVFMKEKQMNACPLEDCVHCGTHVRSCALEYHSLTCDEYKELTSDSDVSSLSSTEENLLNDLSSSVEDEEEEDTPPALSCAHPECSQTSEFGHNTHELEDEKKESTPLCEDAHPLIGSIDQDATHSKFLDEKKDSTPPCEVSCPDLPHTNQEDGHETHKLEEATAVGKSPDLHFQGGIEDESEYEVGTSRGNRLYFSSSPQLVSQAAHGCQEKLYVPKTSFSRRATCALYHSLTCDEYQELSSDSDVSSLSSTEENLLNDLSSSVEDEEEEDTPPALSCAHPEFSQTSEFGHNTHELEDEKKESTPLCEDTHPLIGSIDQDATSSIFSDKKKDSTPLCEVSCPDLPHSNQEDGHETHELGIQGRRAKIERLRAETDSNRRQAEIERRQAEIERRQAKIDRRQAKIDRLRAKILSLSGSRKELLLPRPKFMWMATLCTPFLLEFDRNEAEIEIDRLRAEINRLRAKIDRNEAEIEIDTEIEMDRNEAEIEIDRLRAEIDRHQAKIDTEIDRFRAEIDTRRIRYLAVGERKQPRSNLFLRLRAEINRFRAEIDRLRAKIDRLRAKIDRNEAEIEIDRLRAEIDRNEAEIEIDRLRAEINTLSQVCDAACQRKQPRSNSFLSTPLTLADLPQVHTKLCKARSRWFDIGLSLTVDRKTLFSILGDRRFRNDDDRLREMLAQRLKSSDHLTWARLCDCLRRPNISRYDLANKIEKELKGITQCEVDEIKQENSHLLTEKADQSQVKDESDLGQTAWHQRHRRSIFCCCCRDSVIENNAQVNEPKYQFPLQEHEPLNVQRQELVVGEEIGVGAWGTVHKGLYRGQQVAVKRIHPPENIDRLKQECNFLARLRHPNIVRFIGAVVDEKVEQCTDDLLLIFGEELLNINLRRAYNERNLNGDTLMSVVHDVACALQYLHQRSIIHHDLSAPNVLLEEVQPNTWRAKLSDFAIGSAKLGKTAGVPSSVIYSAPETLPRESPLDTLPEQTTKIDVYSYGVLLVEVIAKEIPTAENRQDMLDKIERGCKPLYDLIMACISQNPEHRPTMTLVLERLNDLDVGSNSLMSP